MPEVEDDLLQEHLDITVLETGCGVVHYIQGTHLPLGVIHDLLLYAIEGVELELVVHAGVLVGYVLLQ